MLVLIYKGIEIHHDPKRDEFFTSITSLVGKNDKKDEVISNPRLQKTIDEVDKWLNVASKKPIIKKIWSKGKYESSKWQLSDVIQFNPITNSVLVKYDAKNQVEVKIKDQYNNQYVYVSCKENDALMKSIFLRDEQIAKLQKENNCAIGKLIPVTVEHFI